MEDAEKNRRLRQLPSVDELLAGEAGRELSARHGRSLALRAARRVIAEAREGLLSGARGQAEIESEDLARALEAEARPGLRRVLNATGVVLHTNLGRAPLARAVADRLSEISLGYSNLELDLESGERGSRHASIEPLLRELTGAEAALAVNNNAGAVLLTLSALAAGREALVSRGELVEIGGGFRVPDVMRQSGVRLVEVGTTNKTRLSDYEAALGPETALLVKVHRSNFALVGFTEEAPAAELAALGAGRGVPLFDDLGSGCLVDTASFGLPRERTVAEAVRDGAGIVTFSGDKLLGGPQAGLVVGRRELVEKLRRHPLHRALRIDKLTAAALEATLRLYRDGREREIPAVAMLAEPLSSVERRAEALRDALGSRGVVGEVVEAESRVGGGALALAEPPSFAVALSPQGGAEPFAARLRSGEPAVVGRVVREQLLLDVRAIGDEEVEPLAAAVSAAWDGPRSAARPPSAREGALHA